MSALAEALAVLLDRLCLIRTLREPEQPLEVELREERAARRAPVAPGDEHVYLKLAFPPHPDFSDSEPAVNVELLDPTGRPHDLDREVGAIALPDGTDDVAFVGLDRSLARSALE